ncbi:MAG: hypothetical protein HKO99_03905 [Xanthomonadales bacterium]|nr:hypothetical protein [Xanthomonadales bacterium]
MPDCLRTFRDSAAPSIPPDSYKVKSLSEQGKPRHHSLIIFSERYAGDEDMSGMMTFKRKQPWRDALIATTALSLFIFAASLLWETGYPQWAFAAVFVAVWLLLSFSWSNVDFTEKSSKLLAEIMDQNFEQMHQRVEQLERALQAAGVSSIND